MRHVRYGSGPACRLWVGSGPSTGAMSAASHDDMGPPDDLLVTWGREFCAALGYPDGVTSQDAYEVHMQAFHRPPEIPLFEKMGTADYAALALAARDILEHEAISDDQMRLAVQSTIWHWT